MQLGRCHAQLLHCRSPFAFPELGNERVSHPVWWMTSGFCQRRIAVYKSNMWGKVTDPTPFPESLTHKDIPIVSMTPCNPTGTGDTVRHLA